MADGRRLALILVCDYKSRKSLFNGLRNKVGLCADLLLFEDIEWPVELRVSFSDFILQHLHLCFLAPQAKHVCPCSFWVSDIPGKQSAQRLRILSCTAASACVRKKLNSIHVGK